MAIVQRENQSIGDLQQAFYKNGKTIDAYPRGYLMQNEEERFEEKGSSLLDFWENMADQEPSN